MYESGKKWLLDAHLRMHADRIPEYIINMNKGKQDVNVYCGKKVVGEYILARNMDNKICIEILWYGNELEKIPAKPEECHVGLFKIAGLYHEQQTTV